MKWARGGGNPARPTYHSVVGCEDQWPWQRLAMQHWLPSAPMSLEAQPAGGQVVGWNAVFQFVALSSGAGVG